MRRRVEGGIAHTQVHVDHRHWPQTTIAPLPKVHICWAAQHWAADFCPSALQHILILLLIAVGLIINAGLTESLRRSTLHEGTNANCVFNVPLWNRYRCAKVTGCGCSDSRLFQTSFDLVARQTDCLVLHSHKERRACSCISIQEYAWAYCKFSPVSCRHIYWIVMLVYNWIIYFE